MLKSFAVVIPSYNNAPWCRQNLDSVLNQEYPRFRVVYVDDASTDGTPELVAQHLAENPRADRVAFVRNTVRVGPTANIDRAVRDCDPNDVVVLVDGDDFLSHHHVLTRLNEIYQDPDVWVTWGQFARFPHGGGGFCAPIPPEIVSANAFRDYPYVASHLRTFYAGLYQRVRVADVQDSGARFFMTAGDVAQMCALQEMAGPRGRFVAETLYLYNRENPLNDDKVDRAAQVRAELEIRGKARYGRLADRSGTSAPPEFCVGVGPGRSLFDGVGPLPDSDERRRPFRYLRSILNRRGHTVRESQTLTDLEDPQTLVVFDVRPEELELLAAYPADALNLVLWKDPVAAPLNFDVRYHEPFRRIYTWCTDLVDNVRYFKLHFPYLRPIVEDLVPFEQRKLCIMIASNRLAVHPDALYSEERKVAAFFAEAAGDSFGLYGWGWDDAVHRNYRGVPLRRVDYLSHYRFSVCYETVRGWNGFVTGKIFDTFAAGCVPVYWGAPDIAESIPADCFIAREDFASDAELHAFLQDMPERVHVGYLERIRAFLSSERAVPYSTEQFVRTFVGLAGGRAVPRAAGPSTWNGAGSPDREAVGARECLP